MNKTSTEKLNEALGIESLDEMLDSISLDSNEEVEELNTNISAAVA